MLANGLPAVGCRNATIADYHRRVRSGRASKTAVLTCLGRAAADGRIPRFHDAAAVHLLPEDARVTVERFRRGERPRGFAERVRYRYIERQSKVMAIRTMAIDDAILEKNNRQLVILG